MKKYFSIPKKYIKYYPKLVHLKLDDILSEKTIVQSKKRKLKSNTNIIKGAKKKVGRPKKIAKFHGLETITKFFRPL